MYVALKASRTTLGYRVDRTLLAWKHRARGTPSRRTHAAPGCGAPLEHQTPSRPGYRHSVVFRKWACKHSQAHWGPLASSKPLGNPGSAIVIGPGAVGIFSQPSLVLFMWRRIPGAETRGFPPRSRLVKKRREAAGPMRESKPNLGE